MLLFRFWWNFFLQADKCNTWNSPREIWVLPNNLQVEDIRTWWNRCFALQHEPWLTCMAIHGKSQKNTDISMKPKLILGKKVGGYVHNKDMRKDYIAAWMNGLNVAIWPRPTLLVAGSKWEDTVLAYILHCRWICQIAPLRQAAIEAQTTSCIAGSHSSELQPHAEAGHRNHSVRTPCVWIQNQSRIRMDGLSMFLPHWFQIVLLWIVMVDSQISVSLREHLLPISSLYRGKARNDLTPRRWNLWFSGTFLGPMWGFLGWYMLWLVCHGQKMTIKIKLVNSSSFMSFMGSHFPWSIAFHGYERFLLWDWQRRNVTYHVNRKFVWYPLVNIYITMENHDF